MGYTHYWKRPRNNFGSPEMFGRLALDAKKLSLKASETVSVFAMLTARASLSLTRHDLALMAML